jgi:hypothetical protein
VSSPPDCTSSAANTIPELDETLVTDRFAVLRNGSIVAPTETTVVSGGLRLAFVEGTGGTVQRNFVRGGFGLQSFQDRDRIEFAARLQNIWRSHTFKYGAEWNENKYKIDTFSTGPDLNFNSADHPPGPNRIENRFAVCARTSTTTITCPSASRTCERRIVDRCWPGAGWCYHRRHGCSFDQPDQPVPLT